MKWAIDYRNTVPIWMRYESDGCRERFSLDNRQKIWNLFCNKKGDMDELIWRETQLSTLWNWFEYDYRHWPDNFERRKFYLVGGSLANAEKADEYYKIVILSGTISYGHFKKNPTGPYFGRLSAVRSYSIDI